MTWTPPAKGPRRTFRIGKYKVLRHIATGGMGAIYKAYDTENQREVALKVLTREMAAKPAMVERFKREARNAGQLHHENIVALYELDEANGTYFIAMEFVDGIDLHEYILRKKVLDPDEARQIMVQASQALEHAHQHGIVHRDIKPSNFLLRRDKGQLLVKLTDLGLSRQTAAVDEFRVTRAGTTVGTVDYISPEQARDSAAADIRSDLYSLGCTWYHMLAGRAPFAEGGLAERLHNHLHKEPEDVRHFNPRVSEASWAILSRLLAKDPADRYQTPAELLADLLLLDPRGQPGTTRAVLEGLAKGNQVEEAAADVATRVVPRASAVRRKVGPTCPEGPVLGNAPAAMGLPRVVWSHLLLAVALFLIFVGILLAILFRFGR
jgi:serine/threonine-protein kinase